MSGLNGDDNSGAMMLTHPTDTFVDDSSLGMGLSLENDVDTSPVGVPEPFPQPQFKRCAVRNLPVYLPSTTPVSEGLGEQQHLHSKMVLQTATNSFYEIGRTLREAIYGQVNHGIILEQRDRSSFRRTNPIQHVAIKVYSIARVRAMHGRSQENPLAELAAMQIIGSHPNLMTGIDYCIDAENLYCIMEYWDGGELFDMIADSGPQPERSARRLMRQILSGLAHLHTLGIMHRDLSLENVLFSRSRGTCKIIDFGMALRLPRDPAGHIIRMFPQGACGKRSYMSPEIVENRTPYDGVQSDIWSTGVIMYILLTGVTPVDIASTIDPRFRQIGEGLLGSMIENTGAHLSSECVDLLCWMLKVIPSQRLSLAEILEHPWMREDDA